MPLLHWGSTDAEIASTMQGDDLIDRRAVQATRSITVHAGAEVIFDFIAQMGFGRAGWYSYDLIDNLGRRSATQVNPAWLVTAAGESVPGGPIEFVAPIVDRPDAFVLQVPQRRVAGHTLDFTLAYALVPEPSTGSTRVVTRVRIAIEGPAGPALEQGLLFGDGVMVRKQLLGLRDRAEAAER